jgi:hypothetical protein
MKYDSDEYRSFEQELLAAGKLIDPATAEMTWGWASIVDPYGVLDREEKHHDSIGRVFFLRAPGSRTWVCNYDLPETTCDKFWELLEARYYKDGDRLPV